MALHGCGGRVIGEGNGGAPAVEYEYLPDPCNAFKTESDCKSAGGHCVGKFQGTCSPLEPHFIGCFQDSNTCLDPGVQCGSKQTCQTIQVLRCPMGGCFVECNETVMLCLPLSP